MTTSIASITLAGLIWMAALTASAAELVMVEEPGCPWCAAWNADIGGIYPKTEEGHLVPLRRMDISERDPEAFTLAKRVVFTPTFLLVDDGREIDRIEGYPGEELFWWRLSTMLENHGIMREEEP